MNPVYDSSQEIHLVGRKALGLFLEQWGVVIPAQKLLTILLVVSGFGSKAMFNCCRNTPIHIVTVGYLSAIRIISGVSYLILL